MYLGKRNQTYKSESREGIFRVPMGSYLAVLKYSPV